MICDEGFISCDTSKPLSVRNMVRSIKRNLKEHRRAWFVSWNIDTDVISDLADKAKCDWLYNKDTGEVRFFEFF